MQKQTILQIKTMLQQESVEADYIEYLRHDQRKGVQKLLKTYEQKQEQRLKLQHDFQQKRQFEQSFVLDKSHLIAGVDEAGRGPLAGPVVVAAVILPSHFALYGLTDSKQVPQAQRDVYYEKITQQAIAYHIKIVDAEQIDRLNIYEATKYAMKEVLLGLSPKPDLGLIDAVDLTVPSVATHSIIKGDAKSISIAAASIIAKVTRDRIMNQVHHEFPMYGFTKHKGYGTKEHLNALQTYGPCKYHRITFSPVKKAIR
ncbi:MAG TPA: ribonuclease HII [Pseudogracilibacillus sp.]|nr:ribonuclease HII [Pseudogracilibacillus sp.]